MTTRSVARVVIGAGAQDGRRLAAELQRHRRQVVGRGMQDVAADAGRAGEQQVVERQRGEGAADVGPAGDEGELVGGEVARADLREQRGGGGRELASLDHRPVARGQDAGERRHHQVHREVPRRDDADHALGLVFHPGARTEQAQRELHRASLPPHPAVDVLQRVAKGRDRAGDVGQHRLDRAAVAEVLRQRVTERFAVSTTIAIARFSRSLRTAAGTGSAAMNAARCAARVAAMSVTS
jgi:hypothetical protein